MNNVSVNQIAARLRMDVLGGVYAPGDRLPEESLARQYGVSRSPVRQALHQLSYEGLLRTRPNCGSVVAQRPSDEVMRVLRRCRADLECIALRSCFSELVDEAFGRMRGILGRLRLACERDDHFHAYELDWEFHGIVTEVAERNGSLGTLATISGATREYLTVDKNRPFHADFGELYAMHASLYAMYRMGNCDLACEALRQHILRGPFVAGSYRCWHAAGRPWDLEGVYEGLSGPLRRAITRRKATPAE